MKIIVYAICKNEEKFVKRFMESMSEADEVVVLDTGSTDNTVAKLKEYGAKVYQKKFDVWRFDAARNYCLSKVSQDADLCCSVDIDEVFEKGWRKKLENNYFKGLKQVRYKYVWSHLGDKDGHVFWGEKIHSRNDFIWVNPVHEVLKFVGENYCFKYVDIRLDHFPDQTKSRAQYLPLLELAVKEDPLNDRNMHYLGREYMFNRQYQKAITTLKRHLEMPTAKWNEERSQSMRFIANCYMSLKKYELAEKWYFSAVSEAPNIREPYLSLAEFYFFIKNYSGVLFACERALEITSPSLTYITEPLSFSGILYDYASVACYYLGIREKAVKYVDQAIDIDGKEERLLNNRKLFMEMPTK